MNIKVNNVTKVLNNVSVLDNVDVEFEQGKIHGLYGSNGSGKTMLFRAISGLIRPTKGNVSVFGKVIGKDVDFAENMGLIIENPGFIDYLTGYENLEMIAMLKNIVSKDDIRKSIVRVGLSPTDKKKYKQYSLGMKQRLAIAQAIMEYPDLIILDEPMNSLDEDGIIEVRQILLEENKRGATIFIASHNKEDITILADYVYKMEKGKITREK